MGDPLTQTQVENEIWRLKELAETVTHELAKRARSAAVADSDYKAKFAVAFLRQDGTGLVREQLATQETAKVYQEKKIAEARLLASQEAGRNYRAQLEALRSVNANLRPLVSP